MSVEETKYENNPKLKNFDTETNIQQINTDGNTKEFVDNQNEKTGENSPNISQNEANVDNINNIVPSSSDKSFSSNIQDDGNEKKQSNTSEPALGEIIQDAKHSNIEEYIKKLNVLEKETLHTCQAANDSKDHKLAKQKLTDIKDKIKNAFLKSEDSNRLYAQIDEVYIMLDERIYQEKKLLEQESSENYNILKAKIDEARIKTVSMTVFNEARGIIIKLQKEVRNAKLTKSHRDELYESVGKIFEDINKRQNENRLNYEMECSENYLNLKKIIEQSIELARNSQSFSKSREYLIKSQGQIKGKTLKRDQREELYQIIRDAFDELRNKENDNRELFEKEVEVNYENLKKIIDDACAFTQESQDFKASRETLVNAQNAIKGLRLKKEQRDEFYHKIRAEFNELNKKQSLDRKAFEDEAVANYNALTEKVNDAFALVYGLENFNMIRHNLIAVQAEIKILRLKRNHRNELFSRIREAFTIFDEKRNKYYSERNQEKVEQLNHQLLNLKSRLTNLNEVLQKDRNILETIENEADKEKIQNKIISTEKSISEVQTKIENLSSEIEKINQTLK